jgi:hypothetical protein
VSWNSIDGNAAKDYHDVILEYAKIILAELVGMLGVHNKNGGYDWHWDKFHIEIIRNAQDRYMWVRKFLYD